jgi:hypothetical protein
MRSFLAFTLALALAAVQPALSNPALTSPVASTSASGGKLLTVAWDDNGETPKTSAWKGINIFLATGDVNTQYKLQQLAANISTHKTSGKYAIDANAGPNGGFYFIRMESVATQTSGIPYMAFSSKFTLKNMSGTFNSTVQAAASQNAAGSSSSSSTTAKSGSSASSSSFSFSVASSTSAGTAATTTGSSAASTSGALSLVSVQQSLVLLGVASATVAGVIALV